MSRGFRRKQLEYEMRFFEKLLSRMPNFLEALIALGDIYTKKGMVEEGLAVDKKLAELRPDDPYILYNLACSYSLMNYVDLALEVIKKAVQCGYNDFLFMEEDEDLENLKKDDRFLSYLSTLKNNAGSGLNYGSTAGH